jgi:hypothetical protein
MNELNFYFIFIIIGLLLIDDYGVSHPRLIIFNTIVIISKEKTKKEARTTENNKYS